MDQHNLIKQTRQLFEFERSKQLRIFYITETIKLSPVIAPFYLISVNLQNLSHFLLNSQSGFRFDKNEIGISKFRPFKVSYYRGYSDAFYDIYRQGILGIYKGNTYRLAYFLGSNQLKYISDFYSFKLKVPLFLKDMFFYSLVDILLHPLLFIESRYSVQPRAKSLQVYTNVLDVIKKSGTELYKGASVSILRNIFFVLGLNTYYIYPGKYTNILAVVLAHTLSYPLLTIQRNIIFQSNNVGFFPKVQTKGIKDTFMFIKNSLGLSFLYRGYVSYGLATIIWHLCVPTLAKSRFQKYYIEQTSKMIKEQSEEEDDIEVFEREGEQKKEGGK